MRDPFVQFYQDLILRGLEFFKLYYGVYRGSVVSNEDPMNIGRLKISCPTLYGNDSPQDWVFARGSIAGIGNGIWWIPSPGDPILITCERGDPRFPMWEYGWWLKGKAPAGANPKTKIFLTPGGHRIELNDGEGNDNFVDVKHVSGFHVKLFSTGIYLGKGDKNIGKLLDDLFQLFQETTVPTPGGPAPFNNAVDYSQLRQDINEFLKISE